MVYKIVAAFSHEKGRGWLSHRIVHGEHDNWPRFELHLMLGMRTLIIDETEFAFISDVVAKAKQKADAERSKTLTPA